MSRETWEAVKRGLGIEIDKGKIESEAKAACRVRAREAQSNVTTKVLEQKANHDQSKALGTLLTLEELPKVLKIRIEDLENTKFYKIFGFVVFHLDTVGTKMNGYYGFDLEGRTLVEMFIPIVDNKGLTSEQGGNESQIKETWLSLPFNERARFFGGNKPLLVNLGRGIFGDWRLGVSGVDSQCGVAPVVVVKQT